MTGNEWFEVKAEAFYLQTGMMAPGKDMAAAAGLFDDLARSVAWVEWCGANVALLQAMKIAFERVMEYGAEHKEGE